MKKRINWFKVVALILMLIEIYIAFAIDKTLVKTDITTWRLYCMCIMFIPINLIYICIKGRR